MSEVPLGVTSDCLPCGPPGYLSSQGAQEKGTEIACRDSRSDPLLGSINMWSVSLLPGDRRWAKM